MRRLTGDYAAAVQALEQALGLSRGVGVRGGEAEALNEKGTLHRVTGDLVQAEGCHRQALDLARAIASPWDEAHALAGLGRCTLAVSHATQAAALLRQALEIFRRIGAAEAGDVSRELAALAEAGPPPNPTPPPVAALGQRRCRRLGRVTASWRLGGQGITLVGALLAGAMAGLLGGDPRPVFAAAGALTLLTVTVAWFAGLRRERLPASLLTGKPESQDPVSAGRERSVINASSPANNASAADR